MSKWMLVLACGAMALSAQEKKVTPTKATPASQGGVRAYKDSATGELRGPTPQELQAEALSAQRASAAAGDRPATQVITNADGSQTAILGEEHMSFAVVTKNADGSLAATQCVTGRQQAEVMLKSTKKLSKAKEHAHDH